VAGVMPLLSGNGNQAKSAESEVTRVPTGESAVDRASRGLTTLKEINKVTFIEAFR